MRGRRHHALAGVALVVLAGGIAAYKLAFLDYSLASIVPRTRYDVEVAMTLDGQGENVSIQTFAPVNDLRQEVVDEAGSSGDLRLDSERFGVNRKLRWSGSRVGNDVAVSYSYSILSRPLRYDLDPRLAVAEVYPAAVARFLRPEPTVQVDAPQIREALVQAGADRGPVLSRLERIYGVASGLRARPFKGTTDALTALRLGEASCNGKSHVATALARAAGIPARLVGGLVMTAGSKRTSHQWVEVYAGGHWIPLDPTNRYFAELPEHYLKLYVGEEALFRHTQNINFDYRFHIATRLVPTERARTVLGPLNVWALFERLGLPYSMLSVLLLLPIAALVVVLFRNVIGMPTYGTFLPALLAAAVAQTGLLWGFVGIAIVIAAATTARLAVHRLELLHSPTLAILLAVVTVTLLGTTLAADSLGLAALAHVSLFPIAVLAITAERFFLSLAEHGWADGLKHLAGTTVVIVACYVVMNSLALQMLVSGFPEIILVVVGVDIYLGHWIGMRLGEYLRFRGVAPVGESA